MARNKSNKNRRGFYPKNYKTLLRKIKETASKCRDHPSSWTRNSKYFPN